jgi:hypothetical protein
MRAHARANNLPLTTVATSVIDGSISRDALVPR